MSLFERLAGTTLASFAISISGANATLTTFPGTALTDVPAASLTISSQAPWASAVTNLKPGDVIINTPAPVGAGTSGALVVQNGGTTFFQSGDLMAGNSNGGLWLGNVARTAATASLYGIGSAVTTINGATGVEVAVNVVNQGKFTAGAYTWDSAVTAPSTSQTALASTSAGSGAAGQGMSVTAQAGQAATGGTNAGGLGGNLTLAPGQGGTSGGGTPGLGGNVTVALNVPLAGTAESSFSVTRGGAFVGSIQPYPTAGSTNSALFLVPGITPSASNYTIAASTSNTTFNAPSGSNVNFEVNNIAYWKYTSALISLGLPVGGFSTTPLSFSGQTSPNTVACGTGGTQTVSAAQSIIPFFLLTTGTLTSNAIVDFTTNAPTGRFEIDLQGVGALGAFTLGFKNGTTTQAWTATELAAFRATGLTAITVETYGANNITIA